ncbi:MAG: polymer-forming cytoskeletal protein [Candidatus Thermoplasmatota archaeon]|jgi:predicted acyltransferase (DUF342 family)|nr:polymer-forming cytoskeletal protein [Candidatus Thermoplasmatota archaeon]
MVFDRKTFIIPDKTRFEELFIVTNGDVVIGDRCKVQFGVKTDGRIFVGEHAIIEGGLEAGGDIRVDIFSSIGGDVISGGNVFIGEKTRINGKLSLKGDLDVGDNVEIEKGFEAKGWINIRNPIPIVIYIFIYLLQLLKMGRSEEIERILKELEENEVKTIPISEVFLFLPNDSVIGTQKSSVDNNLYIGKTCKILGNYNVKGNIFIGDNSVVYGSLKSVGDVYCGKNVVVHGNIDTNGEIKIDEKTCVAGDVSADKIFLSKTASVNGTLLAKNGVSFTADIGVDIKEKIERYEKNADIVDEIDKILE